MQTPLDGSVIETPLPDASGLEAIPSGPPPQPLSTDLMVEIACEVAAVAIVVCHLGRVTLSHVNVSPEAARVVTERVPSAQGLLAVRAAAHYGLERALQLRGYQMPEEALTAARRSRADHITELAGGGWLVDGDRADAEVLELLRAGDVEIEEGIRVRRQGLVDAAAVAMTGQSTNVTEPLPPRTDRGLWLPCRVTVHVDTEQEARAAVEELRLHGHTEDVAYTAQERHGDGRPWAVTAVFDAAHEGAVLRSMMAYGSAGMRLA